MKLFRVCNDLQHILTDVTDVITDADGNKTHGHNIERIVEHVKSCKECQKHFSDFYNNLSLPFIAKAAIDSIINFYKHSKE
jgi:hypothetical protein